MSEAAAQRVALALVSHTNVGKTTLARTLLGRDVGTVRDAPHVTETAERFTLLATAAGDALELWDTPGFGDSVRLARRLAQRGNPLGWFLTEVWDRFRDRAFWSTQQAVRAALDHADVVLYLVNAAEGPQAAGYVEPEMKVLELIGRPVLVLLNQMGQPKPAGAEAAEVALWQRQLAPYAGVRAVLPLDAFARCWAQEIALLDEVRRALPAGKLEPFVRLAAAWRESREATFAQSMQVLARQLAATATDSATVAKQSAGAAARSWLTTLLGSRQGSDVAADADNDWSDGAAVDAHAYAGWTYDYLYKRFNRQGLDNRNLAMSSIVHPVRREDWASAPSSVLNLYYLNAFYAGNGIMVYGEGLPPGVTVGGRQWQYFAGALDVVAHELAHGVTDYTSDLIYRNESGALNEAFSDIIGTSAEHFYQQAGSGYLKADYLLGEDLTAPAGAFRSMADPQAYADPDHYSKRYTGTADNGGVHSNSGIANNAFYLAIEGGVNRTSALAVQGVGAANREKIEKVFYRGFTQMLPANATFSMARAATLQASRDLYGGGSDVERAIEQAWTAVGVQ